MPGMRSAEYQLCECLDNQPIKITTRFSGSDITGRCIATADREEKTTRSNRTKLRLEEDVLKFKRMLFYESSSVACGWP